MIESVELRSEPVLIWGIAGASLGMEIAKSLSLGGYKRIIGCDISPVAFGHFSDVFDSTHLLDRESVEESLSHVLSEIGPRFVLAGGDEVSRIIGRFKNRFADHGCKICSNSHDVVSVASDKFEVMIRLKQAGFTVPETRMLEDESSIRGFPLPAVLKPRMDSGGSRGVFVVLTHSELKNRAATILQNNIDYVLQEYLTEAEGEYTIGVLSNRDKTVAGSILMRRTFQNMLSVHEKTEHFLVSSGSSQGVFKRNGSLQTQAEAIAATLGSVGPLNLQARVIGGNLVPFEINPRFSASTYLRALSGVNEVDLYLRHMESGSAIHYPSWDEGLALRTFGEVFVESGKLSDHVL